jgi:probable F420-dependent oxidoreductase
MGDDRAMSAPAVGGTGLALPLNLGLPIAGFTEVAARAEALGYDRLWAAEAGTADAFVLLTACAAVTGRIGLATGVVPIQTRTPSLMAQAAASVQDASSGRFTLGLGVSSPTIVERWNGVAYDAPLARMREYVGIVRALLAGEKVSHTGTHYRVEGYRVLMALPPPPPILLGALGEHMLMTAGEIADGVCLNWIAASAVPAALDKVRAGGDAKTAVFVRVCVTEDVEAARAWGRRELMGYVIVPAYRRAFERQGFGEVCSTAMRSWDAGDRKAAAASLPDEFVDELCISGTSEQVRGKFERFRAAGVDEPVAFPFSGAGTADDVRAELEATLAALAPATQSG